jgi:ATPase family associated with various cellular activities (AAA)
MTLSSSGKADDAPVARASQHRTEVPIWTALARIDGLLRSYDEALCRQEAISAGQHQTIEVLLASLAAERASLPPFPAGSELPASLAGAARVFRLSPFEIDVLLLALAVEIDARYGEIVACLLGTARATRPTIGLALAVLCPEPGQRAAAMEKLMPAGVLRSQALLVVDGAGPFPQSSFWIPADVWPRLANIGSGSTRFELQPARADALERLVLDAPLVGHTRAVARWLRKRRRRERLLVIIRGPEGSGRHALGRALAHAAGRPALIANPRALEDPEMAAALRRDALWLDAVIVLDEPADPLAGVPAWLQALEAPMVWIALPGAAERLLRAARETVEITLRAPDLATCTAMWQALLPPDGGDSAGFARASEAAHLAGRYRFGPGRIRAAVDLALAHARAFHQTEAVSGSILEDACRRLPEVNLGALAQKLAQPFGRADLVVTEAVRRELDLALAWANQRVRVLHDWGLGRRLHAGRGLTCLFAGPPGTGKTMAAQVLARELGLDIYRIDLSQVVNKYIGETEKNLSRLFDEAERGNVILFFDEADAIFGKRTQVKDAHDRYANVETGFLLQRLEAHEGVVVLATNLRRNLDDAFTRRLQVIIEFPMPAVAERRGLWQGLLPAPAHRADDIDIGRLSESFPLSGGEIKNAVLASAFAAAAEGGPLAMRHLVVGIWREMQKVGRLVEPAAFGTWVEHIRAYRGEATP